MEVTEEIMSEVRTACQFTKTRDDENQKKDHNFGFWVKKKRITFWFGGDEDDLACVKITRKREKERS